MNRLIKEAWRLSGQPVLGFPKGTTQPCRGTQPTPRRCSPVRSGAPCPARAHPPRLRTVSSVPASASENHAGDASRSLPAGRETPRLPSPSTRRGNGGSCRWRLPGESERSADMIPSRSSASSTRQWFAPPPGRATLVERDCQRSHTPCEPIIHIMSTQPSVSIHAPAREGQPSRSKNAFTKRSHQRFTPSRRGRRSAGRRCSRTT